MFDPEFLKICTRFSCQFQLLQRVTCCHIIRFMKQTNDCIVSCSLFEKKTSCLQLLTLQRNKLQHELVPKILITSEQNHKSPSVILARYLLPVRFEIGVCFFQWLIEWPRLVSVTTEPLHLPAQFLVQSLPRLINNILLYLNRISELRHQFSNKMHSRADAKT